MHQESLHAQMFAMAANAAARSVLIDGRRTELPLAYPIQVSDEEVSLRLSSNDRVVLAVVTSVEMFRASTRRWARESGDKKVLAVVFADEALEDEIQATLTERPSRRLQAVLYQARVALWNRPWPPLLHAMEHELPDSQTGIADRLKELEGQLWPVDDINEATPLFEQTVFAMAQAHEVIRVRRGEAVVHLRSGDDLLVRTSDSAEPPSIQDLKSDLAWVASQLIDGGNRPGCLRVGGHAAVSAVAASVFGPRVRLGRIASIDWDGRPSAHDPELTALISMAKSWTQPIHLFELLEESAARRAGQHHSRSAQYADAAHLGLIRTILRNRDETRLQWLDRSRASLREPGQDLAFAFVGSDAAGIDEIAFRWKLADLAGRWNGQRTGFVVAGGDEQIWERIVAAMDDVRPASLFQVCRNGAVRAATSAGRANRPLLRILRQYASLQPHERECSLDDLEDEVDELLQREFRKRIEDESFVQSLQGTKPVATQAMVGALAFVYIIQLIWDTNFQFSQTDTLLLRKMGALNGEGIAAVVSSEPWRLVSSSFLHASWWHFALNAYALWILGRRMEGLLGPERTVLIFILSCLGGSVLHESVGIFGVPAVGASTGILGLLAAQGALTLFRRDLIPDRVRGLLWREAWLNGIIVLALSLLPFVGGWLHLGGALTGFGLVASGLLTIGVSRSVVGSERATAIRPSVLVKSLTIGTASAFVLCLLTAFAVGKPWQLKSMSSVQPAQVFDGAVTVPLPAWVSTPPETVTAANGERRLTVGDLQTDGIVLEVAAQRMTGASGIAAIAPLAALKLPANRDWHHIKIGRNLGAVSLSVADSGRAQAARWVIPTNQVVVTVDLMTTPDTIDRRLDQLLSRIPSGIVVRDETSHWQDSPELRNWWTATRGGWETEENPMLWAVSHAAEVPEASRLALDKFLQSDPTRIEQVSALGGLLDGEAAVLLTGRALARATEGNRATLRLRHIQALQAAGQHDEAIAQSRAEPFELANAYWYAGDDDKAAAETAAYMSAQTFLQKTERSVAESVGEPSVHVFEGWTAMLLGDAETCARRSALALENSILSTPDPAMNANFEQARQLAAFNQATCLIADGETERGQKLFERAMKVPVEVGDQRVLRLIRIDIAALEMREVAGAADVRAMLDRAIAELQGPIID